MPSLLTVLSGKMKLTASSFSQVYELPIISIREKGAINKDFLRNICETCFALKGRNSSLRKKYLRDREEMKEEE